MHLKYSRLLNLSNNYGASFSCDRDSFRSIWFEFNVALKEFKNDSEALLSNLMINNDDDDADLEIKLTLTKIYRDSLLQRQKYKQIARDYGLINNATQFINKFYQRMDLSFDQSILYHQSNSTHATVVANNKLNQNCFINKILNDDEIKWASFFLNNLRMLSNWF